MKFSIAAASTILLAAVQAAEVTFYTDRDCGGDQLGDKMEVPDEGGNVENQIFNDGSPISMKVIGWANVLLTKEKSTKFDQVTCAYCANYYSDHAGTVDDGCRADDGEKCVNINTGFGPGHAELIAVGSPSPADLPCRNYLDRCDFPTPPGNGFCAQVDE